MSERPPEIGDGFQATNSRAAAETAPAQPSITETKKEELLAADEAAKEYLTRLRDDD